MQCASQVTSIIVISQVMRPPWLSSGEQSRKNSVIIRETSTRSLRDTSIIIVKNKDMREAAANYCEKVQIRRKLFK
jgi:hypothetical protein